MLLRSLRSPWVVSVEMDASHFQTFIIILFYLWQPQIDTSRWKRELGTFARLWPLEENKFLPGKSFETKRFVHVLCKAKDGGNILRPAILDEIKLLNSFIMENITIPTYDGKFNLTYQDLCLSYDWFAFFLVLYRILSHNFRVCGANEHIEVSHI